MRKSVSMAALVAALTSVGTVASAARIDNSSALVTSSTAGTHLLSESVVGNQTIDATLYNSGGFETYAAGNLQGQNGWGGAASATRFTVQNTGGVGGTKGVHADPKVTDWIFPALGYTPAVGEGVSVNVDISRNIAGTASFGYAIDIYNTSVQRIARFGLAASGTNVVAFVTSRFNSGTGMFDPAGPVSNVIVTGALSQNTFYNLEARLNLDNQTFGLYSGNALVSGNMPLCALAADIDDADIHVSSNSAATDQGFYDNYVVTTFAIPEPSSLCLLAGVGLVALRRRRTGN